jgi:hypothetical protein
VNRLPTNTAYDEVAATFSPLVVSRYLSATSPWRLDRQVDEVSEIWSLSGDGQELKARIMLPLAADYVDFRDRFVEALRGIALINNWTAQELAENITAARADVLSVHLDQVHADSTIPLRQAEVTIDAIYQMLKSAAITAAAPNRVQRGGRLPAAVSSFLDEGIRLGHTKPGSFVFTVVSRLDAPQGDGASAARPFDIKGNFARKVMETLARGLETTRDLINGGSTNALEAPVQWGLSAGLVESLEVIAEPEGLRSLRLMFHWAVAEPKPRVGREPIMLEHAAVGALARVHERLVQEEEPPHRETLFGQVISLTRDEDGLAADEAGSVVLSAEVNGRKRNVHMTLTGDQHNHAITSYQLKLPLVVTGDLVFERRAWRLTGDVEVDPSFLERGRSPN